jgi:hypothetical protein
MLRLEEWARRHGSVAVDPREPRAGRSLVRGCARPSSEAESRPRWRPALERGGVSPEGAPSPRARRSVGGTALRPSSEAEFRPRGPGADRLMGRPGVPGSWAPVTRPWLRGMRFAVCELVCVFIICERKWVSPGYLGDPWLSPAIRLKFEATFVGGLTWQIYQMGTQRSRFCGGGVIRPRTRR